MSPILERAWPGVKAVEKTGQSQRSPVEDKSSRRNIPIDVLRGYCIVMMVASHTGTATTVNHTLHALRFVSGAEGFVFLSGLVLGMVYRRRLDVAPAHKAYRAIWQRAGLLWLVHCVTVLLALLLSTWIFRYPDLPDPFAIGAARMLWLTLTLQFQPGHMLNILPMYVFLLGMAPLALELLRRGKTVWLLAASCGVFLYCQWFPGMGAWVHPISGGEAFPPLAWQVLFIPGLCIGYHHARIREKWIAPYRRLLRWILGAACIAMAIIVNVQTPTFAFYDHATWDGYLWERHPLRFGRVLYFFLAVAACYLMVQAWWNNPRLPRFPLTFLATLGRNSLYVFIVHLVFGFGLDALAIPPERWLLLEAIPITNILAVYLMVRYNVARRWIPN